MNNRDYSKCHENDSEKHEPDFNTAKIEYDGDSLYIDVHCRHCGQSGCLLKVEKATSEIQWD